MKNAYQRLPDHFVPVMTVDATKKKTAVLLNVAALLLTLVCAFATYALFLKGWKITDFFYSEEPWQVPVYWFAFCGCLIAYLFLHELVHGLVYALMTREKLTYGLSLACAYCGVPNVYVSKKTALCALLAPFTVFSAVFLGTALLTQDGLRLGALLLFSLHFGGCAGDLYDTFLLVFCLRGDVLMKDTGPRQVFYQIKGQ